MAEIHSMILEQTYSEKQVTNNRIYCMSLSPLYGDANICSHCVPSMDRSNLPVPRALLKAGFTFQLRI